jgi:3-oxoadipate enol-lactonase
VHSVRTSDGLRLAYRIDDFTEPWLEPETVLLLHSAMGRGLRFFSWIPELAAHYKVVTPDLRGHGGSEVPDRNKPLTIDRLRADIRELMDHIGCASAHFVGASAGGYLSQRMAMDDPDRVMSLSLFGSTPGLKQSQAPSWIPMIREKGLRTFLADTISDRFPVGRCDPGLVEWFLDQAGSNDTDFIIKFITLMAEQDWSDELGKIRCPSLVVIPGLGKIGDNAAYEPMRQKIADVTMKIYADTPHNVWDFMPARCVADVLDFLASARRPA